MTQPTDDASSTPRERETDAVGGLPSSEAELNSDTSGGDEEIVAPR